MTRVSFQDVRFHIINSTVAVCDRRSLKPLFFCQMLVKSTNCIKKILLRDREGMGAFMFDRDTHNTWLFSRDN